ncbi:uncharacterized protein AKAW2_70295S [Aspergillus luchuensis]|uniref:Uncharacterized protein n=1 Tax=Aspergillus kawachii TaxID=1069201 RepID=A0A7R7X5E8_ASPKA|nr:uncharacterized protein AKAW2_70295S [Aspergillus luchuensis]BCS03417.1 hypothetical protein AKAW2_70295S [Aspergillus luchuensis]BCS15045.1 hypothetical protein ALUC_70278S [Aspergillus luchuensis]
MAHTLHRNIWLRPFSFSPPNSRTGCLGGGQTKDEEENEQIWAGGFVTGQTYQTKGRGSIEWLTSPRVAARGPSAEDFWSAPGLSRARTIHESSNSNPSS